MQSWKKSHLSAGTSKENNSSLVKLTKYKFSLLTHLRFNSNAT